MLQHQYSYVAVAELCLGRRVAQALCYRPPAHRAARTRPSVGKLKAMSIHGSRVSTPSVEAGAVAAADVELPPPVNVPPVPTDQLRRPRRVVLCRLARVLLISPRNSCGFQNSRCRCPVRVVRRHRRLATRATRSVSRQRVGTGCIVGRPPLAGWRKRAGTIGNIFCSAPQRRACAGERAGRSTTAQPLTRAPVCPSSGSVSALVHQQRKRTSRSTFCLLFSFRLVPQNSK